MPDQLYLSIISLSLSLSQDWSSSCHINDTNIHWHISTPEEYQLVDRILREILGPELDRLKNVMEGKITLDR